MELFNEFLSGRVQTVIDLMLAGGGGRVFTLEQLADILSRDHVLENVLDVVRDLEKLGLLVQVEKGRFRLSDEVAVRGQIPPPLSRLEEAYLNYALRQPEASSFLGELAEKEQGGAPTPFSHVESLAGGKGTVPVPCETFQTILQAITKRYTIRYAYRTRADAALRQDEQIPFRLEHQVFDRRWWLILYLPEQDRTVKVRLEHLSQVRLGRPHGVRDEEIQAVIRRRYLRNDRVRLLVREEKNGVERAFLTLGRYPELTASRQDDGRVALSFGWFAYDLEEIVKKLMYLGNVVTVLGPPEIRDRLAQRLRKAVAVQNGTE